MRARLLAFAAVVRAFYAGRLAEHTREMFEAPCVDGVEGHNLDGCDYGAVIVAEYRKSHDPDDGFAVANVIYERRRRHEVQP